MNTTISNTWNVYAHDWAVDYLRKGMVNNRIRQAYLVTGMPSIGKDHFAHVFAMALNCQHDDITQRPCWECRSCRLVLSGNHPDMVYSETDPNTGTLKIEAIRAVMQRLALKPYEARYRVAIMADFERARPQAQDALLKTLEEPPPHAVLILLAASTEQIMPTITSRSQVIPLRPVPTDTLRDILERRYEADPETALLLARLSGGRIGWAISALANGELLQQRAAVLDLLESITRQNRAERFKVADALAKEKQALAPVLELWMTFWRDLLLMALDTPVKPCNTDRMQQLERLRYDVSADEALTALKATQAVLANLSINVNLRLALEVMLLDYPGLSRA